MRKQRKNDNKEERFTQYITKDGRYQFIGNPTLVPELPPGIYEIAEDLTGSISFTVKNVITSKYIELPTMVTSSIISDIKTFWKKETKQKFDKFGLVYKRGAIMYGPPGTGKSCTVFKVIAEIVKMGGIAIYDPNPQTFSEAIKTLHSIQGETPIVCIFEEFDRSCSDSSFLSLLDGDLQVPSIYYLATTNHIERIPDAIKNRPSRFAKIIKVDKPDIYARAEYIKSFFEDISESKLSEWLNYSQNMVLDQIKDMIISVECFGETLESSRNKALTILPIENTEEDKEEEDNWGN